MMTATQNGAGAYESSGSHLLNFFSSLGGIRNKGDEEILGLWGAAYGEQKTLALRALFYARDIRGGQGIRSAFRVIVRDLAEKETLSKEFVYWIAHYGRWDDTFELLGTPNEDTLKLVLSIELGLGNALLCKWMPREKSSKKDLAKKLRNLLGLSAKDYRKMLSSGTSVVESQMCSQEWSEIEYAHVPSQAGLRYKDAFARNDGERYQEYLDGVLAGGDKINASTLYPHQLVQKCFEDKYDNTVQAMWDNLPDYLGGSEESILPVIDVSGSMAGLPMVVAIGLGMYLAERNKGLYENRFLTFSESPIWTSIPKGSLDLKVEKVRMADWGMNTNLELVFDMFLDLAQRDPANVPSKLIVLSDMEFDQASARHHTSESFFSQMKARYDDCGVAMPQVVFWNLNGSPHYPVRVHETGTMLVSGFSPSIMKHILQGGGELTPFQLMLNVLGSDRYATIYL